MAWRLVLARVLVRARDPAAASAVAKRMTTTMSRPASAEVFGPYWKDPELIELHVTVDLVGQEYAVAAIEALDLLGRIVVSMVDVRVDVDARSLRAVFVAADRSPTGTSVPGLEWFSAELAGADTAKHPSR